VQRFLPLPWVYHTVVLNIAFNRLIKLLFSETYRLAFPGRPQITSMYMSECVRQLMEVEGGREDRMKV
jgi:hypothetical protein